MCRFSRRTITDVFTSWVIFAASMCADSCFLVLDLGVYRKKGRRRDGCVGIVNIFVHFILLAWGVAPVAARSQATPEQAVINNVASAVNFYALSNNGAYPTNWQQLETASDLTTLNDML